MRAAVIPAEDREAPADAGIASAKPCNGQKTSATISASAERQRRRRQRARQGVTVITIEVDEFALSGALIETRRLSAWDSESRAKIASALGGLIADWVTSVTRDAHDVVPRVG